MKKTMCIICNTNLVITWTDTHGVGACCNCNSPYRIYHYEGEGENRKRVDKPAELLWEEDFVDFLKTYWETHKSKIPNGCNMLGSSYEQCSKEELTLFQEYTLETQRR